jgi:tetratricopeptide (TPR) repeat protein
MATISEALDVAVKHHQAGNLAEAERLYREILQRDTRHPDAWHLLGLVSYARGHYGEAIQQIGHALAADPAQASFYNHLAEAQRALGQLEQAQQSCRQALALKGDYATAHNTLGTILEAQGQAEQALASYRQALALDPHFAQAHYNLATACEARGELQQAEAAYRQAIALQAHYPLALHRLGVLLQRQSRYDEAIACYRQALALQPEYAEAHCNLGSALKDQGRTAEALESYRRALALDPALAEAHFNLGVVYQGQGQLPQAEDAYRKALQFRPKHAQALSNLGSLYKSQGKLEEALSCCEAALQCQPDLTEAHFNRSLIWLLQGDFARGWPEYEWRSGARRIQQRAPARSRWQGEPVAGGSVLLVAEQGLGDTIQFVRYAPLVKQRSGAEVLLHCLPAVASLLAGAAGVDRIVADPSREAIACYAPLLSLPALFSTTLETIPAAVPYIAVDPPRVEHWRGKLAGGRFKVGIAWQGNPDFPDDARRSLPLVALAPLVELPGVSLYSLQKQHGCEQLAQAPFRSRIRDLAPELHDFHDTAAAMRNLDLVITCDSAPAHLAGALGVPVWVAIPLAPDWRWLLGREDSPWYPTMRLFRQSAPGDWSDVIARMAAALVPLSRGGGLD